MSETQPFEVSQILPHCPPTLLAGFLPQVKHAHLLPTLLLRPDLEFFHLAVVLLWTCLLLGCDTVPHWGLPRAGQSGGLL